MEAETARAEAKEARELLHSTIAELRRQFHECAAPTGRTPSAGDVFVGKLWRRDRVGEWVVASFSRTAR